MSENRFSGLLVVFPVFTNKDKKEKKETKPKAKSEPINVDTPISPFEAWDIMKKQGSKVFTVEFIKKDGTLRVMNCRLGVKKDLKGGVNKAAAAHSNLCPVFDMQKNEYRMINLESLISLKAAGKTYKVQTLTTTP